MARVSAYSVDTRAIYTIAMAGVSQARWQHQPNGGLEMTQGDRVAKRPGIQLGRSANTAAKTAAEEDAGLASRIARGEPAAIREATEQFLPMVYAVARRMLRNDSDADDVAQETFLRVWKNAGRWSPKGARLSTWVTRIAINLCYDRLRKVSRGQVTPLEDAPELADDAPRADTALATRENAGVLEQAVASLPERQRAAIVLVHYEEMSNIEAAKAMEISVDALESLLARGRRGLKQSLMAQKDDLLGEVS